MSNHLLKDLSIEGAKASPPVAVITAAHTSGWSMNQTLTALTILYVLLQIGWLVWRWHQAATKGSEIKADGC